MKEKKVSFEIIRIVACLLVIFNHASKRLFDIPEWCYSKTNYASLICFFIAKTAVPLFLMVSGANLIRKNDTFKKYMCRIFRVAVILVVASMFYYFVNNEKRSAFDFLRVLYTEQATTALWYMYLYLGIILLLPIIRGIKLNDGQCRYLMILTLVGVELFPFLHRYFDVTEPHYYLTASNISVYVVFFVLGDWISAMHSEEKKVWKCIGGVILGILSLVLSLCTVVNDIVPGQEIDLTFAYNKTYYVPTYVLAIVLFYAFCQIPLEKIPNKCKRVILFISECTFGIYLISDYFIKRFDEYLGKLCNKGNHLFAVIVYTIAVFLLGLVCVRIWRFIRGMLMRLFANLKRS